jgi:integrase
LQQIYSGKTEIIFSLKTKNRGEAETLARKHGVEYDEKFRQARTIAPQATNAPSPIPSPTPSSSVRPSVADGLVIDDFEILVARYVARLRQLRERYAENGTYENFKARLRSIINENKEFIELGEHPLDDIERPLWHVEAELKAAKIVLKGKAFNPPVQELGSLATESALNSPSLSLADLLAKWALERKPDPRSITYYGRAVAKLTEYCNVKHVHQVTKASIVKLKDRLLEVGTTTVTTNIYLTNLTTLFNFAINNAFLEVNPAKGIRVQVREGDKKERDPFTATQLNKLFSSEVYSKAARPAGGKGEAAYWLPLLGLFTGARLNELCQMNKADIREEPYYDEAQQEHRCWVIDITDTGEGQKLKNSISKRRIPIHPSLIKLGFIDFVHSSPGPRVFHELVASKAYDSISASWSKWFSRYLTHIGLKSDTLVFHSFRHSFKYYARMNNIADAHQFAIQGHSSGNVGDNYGGSVYPLAPLVEAMSKYQIPNLVLPTTKS